MTYTSLPSTIEKDRALPSSTRRDGNNLSMNPTLPITMVGSYAMPGWLERLKTDYFARRISRHDLDEIYDAAAKAAIKDQEIAGLDIITDGEPRRDNMV